MSLDIVRLIAGTLVLFCAAQTWTLLLSWFSLLLLAFAYPWLLWPAGVLCLCWLIGLGYFALHAPLPSPIARATGRERRRPL